jgi:hypothetical protein
MLMIDTKLEIDRGASAFDCTKHAFKPAVWLAPALVLSACLGLAASAPAAGDAVIDWNAIADTASVAAGGPPIRARITAMSQIAVHDALNSIGPRYASYTGVLPVNTGASPEAAVATAAFVVLSETVPSQAGALAVVYDAWMASEVPDCSAAYPTCIEDGVAAGEAAADAILVLRTGDGSATPHLPYTLPPGPGVYQSTPASVHGPAVRRLGQCHPVRAPSR